IAADASADERRVRARIHADRDIVTFVHEIDVAVFRDDLELDFRVAAAELRGELTQHRLADQQRHADPQLAPRLKRALAEALTDLENLGHQRAGSLVQCTTFLGELELPRAALEKT